MAFVPSSPTIKDWKSAPDERTTPITGPALKDLEARSAEDARQVAGELYETVMDSVVSEADLGQTGSARRVSPGAIDIRKFGVSPGQSIDAAVAHARTELGPAGGDLYIPGGDLPFYVEGPLVDTGSGIGLVGDGWTSRLKAASSIPAGRGMFEFEPPATSGTTFDSATVSGMRLRGLCLDGTNSNWETAGLLLPKQTLNTAGAVIADPNYSRLTYLESVIFTNFAYGMRLRWDQGFVGVNLSFLLNMYGLYASDNAQLGTLLGCEFRNNFAAGMLLEASQSGAAPAPGVGDVPYGWYVARTQLEQNNGDGSTSTHGHIMRGDGLVLDGASNNTFDSLKVEGNGNASGANRGASIRLTDRNSNRSPDGNIFDNLIMNNGTAGRYSVVIARGERNEFRGGVSNDVLGGILISEASDYGAFQGAKNNSIKGMYAPLSKMSILEPSTDWWIWDSENGGKKAGPGSQPGGPIDDGTLCATWDIRTHTDPAPLYAAANGGSFARVRVQKTGTLHDFQVIIGTSSGNIAGAIFDIGQTTSGTRKKLWSTGSIASPGTGIRNLGDPNLKVYKGQELEFWIAADNATVTFERTLALAYPLLGGLLDTNGLYDGMLAGYKNSAFPLTSDITTGVVSAPWLPAIAARIA